MNRPWQVWSIFAVCTLLVLAAMGWVSRQAITSDLKRSQAEWEMQREQQVSLALWRMDTMLAPLIAEEAARPHYFFDSFLAVDSAAGEFGGMTGAQARWQPSPLLNPTGNVLLNFENSGTGNWKSPQVPDKEFQELAATNGLSPQQLEFNRRRLSQLAREIDLENLLAQLPQEQVPNQPANVAPEDQQAAVATLPNEEDSLGRGGEPLRDQSSADAQQIALPKASQNKLSGYGKRSSRFQGIAQQEFAKQRGSRGGYGGEYGVSPPTIPTSFVDAAVTEGLSRPLWVGDQLLLARRIVRDGQEGVQGSWLNWTSIKQELLTEVEDLFPRADLKPLSDPEQGDPARMLAGLPVELAIPSSVGVYTLSSALRWTLGLGWIAILASLIAVAALLWGVVALSERRAAFVSSVTHELRTPLTTFRMYADMLARDMVPSASKRHEYLETLQREAERLTHLVENVLSYARLERGRAGNTREQTTVGALVDRQVARLTDRAAQADMSVEFVIDDQARESQLTTDVGVVEQILFNLVDNATKYAAGADDRRIVCTAQVAAGRVQLTIRDFGPGFDSKRQMTRPRPFSKTAEQAAVSAPGVGLGLALCRRLAKQLGGRLEISASDSGGIVRLELPLS